MEEMRGGLKGLSASLAASKGAKAKLEAKVSHWETKLAEVRAMGDEERIIMPEATLCKAKAKVADNKGGGGKNSRVEKIFAGGLESRALHAKKKLSHYFHNIWNFFLQFRAAN